MTFLNYLHMERFVQQPDATEVFPAGEEPPAGARQRLAGIRIANLTFAYRGRQIFSGFELTSAKPRIVLKGPSGCGKTTLLRLLFRSLPANTDAVLPQASSTVFVLQEDALFPWMTGRDNVTRLLGHRATSMDQHSLFPVVRLFIERPAFQMSFGQRRAIELFRAILAEPDILYLDEPFNYLDDGRTSALIDGLVALSQRSTQLVLTTHRHDHTLDSISDVFTFAGDPPYTRLERRS